MLTFAVPPAASASPEAGPRRADVLILGGGPAGLTAGLYAARNGLDALLLERGLPGGQMATSDEIENCPGCGSASGAAIGERMLEQAVHFGLRVHHAEIEALDLTGEDKVAVTADGSYSAPAAIIALGAQARRLGVPGEDAFFGRGVSTCATCDGPFFRDRVVTVVGGGDAAVQEAAFLTRFARKVIVIHRRDRFRAERILQRRLLELPGVETRLNRRVEAILGTDQVAGIRLQAVDGSGPEELPVDGVFIFIGFLPNTALLAGQVDLDPAGYLLTDAQMRTNLHHVYAVGDVRAGALRQIVTSAADGATAAITLTHDLERLAAGRA